MVLQSSRHGWSRCRKIPGLDFRVWGSACFPWTRVSFLFTPPIRLIGKSHLPRCPPPAWLPGDCWEGLLPPSDPKQKMGGWIFFIPKDTNIVVCLLWWPAQLQRLWNNHPLKCAGSLEITLTHSETPVQMRQPPWKSHQVIWHRRFTGDRRDPIAPNMRDLCSLLFWT